MRNRVSKKPTSINIFFLIFAFFPIGHHYVLNRDTSYCKTYQQKAALLFDKTVRKAELLHMVRVAGLEPAAKQPLRGCLAACGGSCRKRPWVLVVQYTKRVLTKR